MEILVFDTSPLSAFARAKRLHVLEALTAGTRRVTTAAVIQEIEDGLNLKPELAAVLRLEWLEVVPVDRLEEIILFASYAERLVANGRNVGEASALAYAEAHGATVLTDDQDAVQIAQERKVQVRRTLAVVARGIRRRLLTENEAQDLVDALMRGGARFPLGPGQFLAWARDHGLI